MAEVDVVGDSLISKEFGRTTDDAGPSSKELILIIGSGGCEDVGEASGSTTRKTI